MNIITRPQAIANPNKYIGKDLMELAHERGITTFKDGKQNKGWKGLVSELLAGLNNNNMKAPNGLTFELKTVSFYHVKGILVPKETMAITMINPEELVQQSFYDSHCWHKLKVLILCAIMWHGKHARKAELLKVVPFDFSKTDAITLQIKADYDFIRNKLIKHGFESLTGKDGVLIQARTKGAGHGSISRAFYAKKELVKRIYESVD
jgi:DNA mismatch repair protein MutH